MSDAPRASVLRGPLRAPVNPSAGAPGSIHDDATARRLGFRGGTVAGDVLMDQCPPLLVECFGPAWFERGALRLHFRRAIEGGDPVRVCLERPAEPAEAHALWLEADDGTRIAEGHAYTQRAPDGPAPWEPGGARPELRILRDVHPGQDLGKEEVRVDLAEQRERMERGFIGERLPWYSGASPWGGPIAAPSTAIGRLLYAPPVRALRNRVAEAVGLFGAIELRHVRGPLHLGRSYTVTGQVCSVGESPRTEWLWFASEARDAGAEVVATLHMMLRFMKASSELYPDAASG